MTITMYKTIYKKDTKGNTRYLSISIDSDGLLEQTSGIVGTDNPVTHSKFCKPKNVGKANETTAENQAISEAESLIKDKLTKGYSETLKELEVSEVILPMLAKDYKKESHKIDWNDKVYIQPKLDGMRCLAFVENGKVTLMSRTGKEITTVPFINKSLLELPDNIYDGELYCHGIGFQANMELIKKYRAGESEDINYHIYDFISKDNFGIRYFRLNTLRRSKNQPTMNSSKKYYTFVDTYDCNSENDLKKIHKEFIKDGYEGSIVRLDGEYKINGRSSDLLKYKDFQDIACKIIDIEPADQRPEWAVPVLTYKGKTFRAGMKYSHADREKMLKNKKKYIGKTAELRFFEFTDEGVPRFPIMVGIRLDK